ncbi:hypothetical protein C8Q74DRAFT_1219555 [Fomes fomentarius]|nr:hypothetical protein C8Q74DRAFT_1219555 [Fomes fomentarius]
MTVQAVPVRRAYHVPFWEQAVTEERYLGVFPSSKLAFEFLITSSSSHGERCPQTEQWTAPHAPPSSRLRRAHRVHPTTVHAKFHEVPRGFVGNEVGCVDGMMHPGRVALSTRVEDSTGGRVRGVSSFPPSGAGRWPGSNLSSASSTVLNSRSSSGNVMVLEALRDDSLRRMPKGLIIPGFNSLAAISSQPCPQHQTESPNNASDSLSTPFHPAQFTVSGSGLDAMLARSPLAIPSE